MSLRSPSEKNGENLIPLTKVLEGYWLCNFVLGIQHLFFVGGCFFFCRWLGQVGIPTHTCIRNVHKQVFDKCTILFSALDNTFLLLGVGK